MRPFLSLHGKRFLFNRWVRIFCDAGEPIYNYLPRFHKIYYAPCWNMWGFIVSWLGREFHFSFGNDKLELYNYYDDCEYCCPKKFGALKGQDENQRS